MENGLRVARGLTSASTADAHLVSVHCDRLGTFGYILRQVEMNRPTLGSRKEPGPAGEHKPDAVGCPARVFLWGVEKGVLGDGSR